MSVGGGGGEVGRGGVGGDMSGSVVRGKGRCYYSVLPVQTLRRKTTIQTLLTRGGGVGWACGGWGGVGVEGGRRGDIGDIVRWLEDYRDV